MCDPRRLPRYILRRFIALLISTAGCPICTAPTTTRTLPVCALVTAMPIMRDPGSMFRAMTSISLSDRLLSVSLMQNTPITCCGRALPFLFRSLARAGGHDISGLSPDPITGTFIT